MTIDFTKAGGQVRLLISDVDEGNFALTDEMVAGFLTLYRIDPDAETFRRGGVMRAAADALDTIATSEALVSKVIRTGDGLTTDGAKLAEVLRKRAWWLRQQADKDDKTDDGAVDSYFGVAEFEPYPPRYEAAERWF